MTRFTHHVAIIVPRANATAGELGAKAAWAQIRGKEERGFVGIFDRSAFSLEGDAHGVAEMAIHEDLLPALPALAADLGATVEVTAIVESGELQRASSLAAVLENLGLILERTLLWRVNFQDSEDLQTLTGVGATLAQRIIDHRPYQTVAELVEVQGISQSMVDGWEVMV